VVDDTNLAPKHEERSRQLARENFAGFEVVDFTHVSLDECLTRDRGRAEYVGEKVIRDMHDQFLRKQDPLPAYVFGKRAAVIVDVDGTVARIASGRSPYDWSRVLEDVPRKFVIDAVRGAVTRYEAELIFVSGRDSRCRTDTTRWLIDAGFWDFRLLMRAAGDVRNDAVVKRELYEQFIKGEFNVMMIFDDRPRVIRLSPIGSLTSVMARSSDENHHRPGRSHQLDLRGARRER
jgi:hypothetical protein